MLVILLPIHEGIPTYFRPLGVYADGAHKIAYAMLRDSSVCLLVYELVLRLKRTLAETIRYGEPVSMARRPAGFGIT